MVPVTGARNEAARRIGRRIERPPAHWSLLALMLSGLLLLLGAQGISTATTGRSATATSLAGAPALHGSAAIWRIDGDRLVPSEEPVGRRVALTFDDGPDPKWTPKIAAVLRREGVPGTFFVVGSQAARHREVLRDLVAGGNELGNHTFTHTSLSDGPMWQRRSQLELTEGVIVGTTGRFTRLVRPPYSATSDAIDPHQERELARAAGKRYLIVLTDYDSKDWQRHGVASIVRSATPKGSRGGVIEKG